MRSHKLSIVTATVLTSLSLASVSFADDMISTTTTTTTTPTTAAPATAGVTSSSFTTSSTTPSAPTTPATASATSTTTTTSADADIVPSPTSAAPLQAAPATHEETTLYDHRRPQRALMFTGGALLVGTYVTTAGVTGADGSVGDHDLYIPVVGPWINLASRTCTGDCSHETRDKILIGGSGILQGVGAAMLVTSFFIPEKVAVARINAGPVKMIIAPTAGGAGAVGTF